MSDFQASRCEEHSADAQDVAKVVVMAMVPVPDVADDWVRGSVQVSADLVTAAGERVQTDQRVATALVSTDAPVALAAVERFVFGDCFLSGFRFAAVRIGNAIEPRREWPIDHGGVRRPASHDGEVPFLDSPIFEFVGKESSDLGTQSEQQNAGGASIEPMRCVDPLADLVAQQRQDILVFPRVDPATMDEHSRRLVDGDAVIVAVEDFQFSRH